jgi:hypothetical protein
MYFFFANKVAAQSECRTPKGREKKMEMKNRIRIKKYNNNNKKLS